MVTLVTDGCGEVRSDDLGSSARRRARNASLGGVRGQGQAARVRVAGLVPSIQATEQVGAAGVEIGVIVQYSVGGEAVQACQAGGRSLDHGQGHRPIQLDHWGGGGREQRVVQGQDLRPVVASADGGGVVERGDGRLELVRPGARGP